MTLTPGVRLGHYEVVSLIGQGGMGEVYLARDTELRRDVALKVLPPAFARDPDRVVRFQREAEVLASLNHPNIATIYGLVRGDHGIALAMEFVDGQSPRGPMPLDDAWVIASQMAAGLEYAHDRGVVHRDLKPANVKVTADGVVKLLDFGLAKAYQDPPSGSDIDPNHSPTISAGTVDGTILGTAAYMAPEQARGKRVDRRADIWSWGVVLTELLTGRRVFGGTDVQETLSLVLTERPDMSAVPSPARRLLTKCLEKDPQQRLKHIGDASSLLEASGGQVPAVRRRSGWLWPSLAVTSLLAAATIAIVHFQDPSTRAAETIRFRFDTADLAEGVNFYMAFSPDGRRLAYTAASTDGHTAIWVRRMDTLESRMLANTDEAASLFWSPDSRMIGFSVGPQLRKVNADGGSPPVTLCALTDGNSGMGTWSSSGTILFGGRGTGPIRAVPDSGGPAVAVTALDGEAFHSFPVFLPDGRHFFYFRGKPQGDRGIFLGSLDRAPGEQGQERLIATRFGASYVAGSDGPTSPGRVVFLNESTLMAQAFNPATRSFIGEPVAIAEGVASAGSGGYFTAAPSGLAFRAGGPGGARRLTWFDRSGARTGTVGEPGGWDIVALSRDQAQIVASRNDGQLDLWVHDVGRGSNMRLTFDPGPETSPVWSNDGRDVVYRANAQTDVSPAQRVGSVIMRRAFSGAGRPEVLLESSDALITPQDLSSDGRYLMYLRTAPPDVELHVLPLTGLRRPVPYLPSPFPQVQAKFSPDGRWVAYSSAESGTLEVFVQPFVEPGAIGDARSGKWMISTAGGSQPRWRKDGKEIVFVAGDGRLTAVDVSIVGDEVRAGVPKPLFTANLAGGPFAFVPTPRWDMTSDGQRFLVISEADQQPTSPVTVVLNWQTDLSGTRP